MKAILAVGAALVLCTYGCTEESMVSRHRGDKNTIRQGMLYKEAEEALKSIKATEFTYSISDMPALPADGTKLSFRYWLMPDKTAIVLRIAGPTDDDMTVRRIKVGPKGTGYPVEKHERGDWGKSVQEINLSQFLR